jgi:hypothetical protein
VIRKTGLPATSNGLTAYIERIETPGEMYHVWFQSGVNLAEDCLHSGSNSGCQYPAPATFSNVLEGTQLGSFQDDVGHQHVYCQATDRGNFILEQAWSGASAGGWVNVSNPHVLYLLSKNATKPYYLIQPSKSDRRNTNDPGEATSCGGWCVPLALGPAIDFNSALTVTGTDGEIRAYYITPFNTLGEIQMIMQRHRGGKRHKLIS